MRGRIDPTILQAFPRLSARTRGQDTVLSGPLPDQSALYGVVHQFEALGLELLEIHHQKCADEGTTGQIT